MRTQLQLMGLATRTRLRLWCKIADREIMSKGVLRTPCSTTLLLRRLHLQLL